MTGRGDHEEEPQGPAYWCTRHKRYYSAGEDCGDGFRFGTTGDDHVHQNLQHTPHESEHPPSSYDEDLVPSLDVVYVINEIYGQARTAPPTRGTYVFASGLTGALVLVAVCAVTYDSSRLWNLAMILSVVVAALIPLVVVQRRSASGQENDGDNEE